MVMKNLSVIFITSLLYSSVNQAEQSRVLEKTTGYEFYLSKQQLSLITKPPRINSMQQDQHFISRQVNINADGNNIVGDAASEPSLAVSLVDKNKIAIGWRQFNTVSNDFRQAGNAYSDNGGQTWHNNTVIEPGVFRSDPVIKSDVFGNFYYHSLRVTRSAQGDYDQFFIDQWKSKDGGKTWVEKTDVYGGDKTWIAIDITQNASQGNIYAAWNTAGNSYYPATFNHSLNNGIDYSYPIEIPQKPIFGTVTVDGNGNVYVVGMSNFSNISHEYYLIKSINPNVPMPLFDQVTQVDLGGLASFGGSINPDGLNGQIYVKVDSSNRTSKDNVYIMGTIIPNNNDPQDVMFVRSTDGGKTFSSPIVINHDDKNSYQWLGAMNVAPNGRIDIIWYDTINSNDNKQSELFYTYSYDAGMTFARQQAISPSFFHNKGYPIQKKMGDYIDIESDNLGAHIAYTATFNDEQDIYYLYAKPSTREENPDFPSLLTNNAWVAQDVPSQGILSSTLISNNTLLAFETIFTATPDGTPMWLVANGEIPISGDSYSVPIYMPTGSLSENQPALLAIGILTKTRLRDENNELIDNRIQYHFDMTDAIKPQLEALGIAYEETFFNNNPFHTIDKTLGFHSSLPRQQLRKDLCTIHGQVLISTGEKNEGRVQFTYRRNDVLNLFAADFTYKKSINNKGELVFDLDNNGHAIPTWEVINSDENGILADNSVRNIVYRPNGGLGFFTTGNDPGITEIGIETIIENDSQLLATKPNQQTESMHIVATNVYCGEDIY